MVVVLRGRMKRVVLRGRMKRIVGRLLQRVVVAVRGGVGFRIVDRVMIQVCLERLGGVVPAQVARPRRPSRRVVWDLAGMGVAVISASRLVSVNIRMSRISSMVGLRQVVGGVLQQVVRGDQVELDSRVNDCVMVHGWLERGGGVVVSARWGRLHRGVFVGRGHGRVVGDLAATAVVRNMPGRLCGVVPGARIRRCGGALLLALYRLLPPLHPMMRPISTTILLRPTWSRVSSGPMPG